MCSGGTFCTRPCNVFGFLGSREPLASMRFDTPLEVSWKRVRGGLSWHRGCYGIAVSARRLTFTCTQRSKQNARPLSPWNGRTLAICSQLFSIPRTGTARLRSTEMEVQAAEEDGWVSDGV